MLIKPKIIDRYIDKEKQKADLKSKEKQEKKVLHRK